MVGIFRTPAEADHFAAFHRLPRPGSAVFRILRLMIRIEEGSITVRRVGEDRLLPEAYETLDLLETLLVSN